MKITCHSCQSKYTVSDEKVQGKTVKIKCRKCGTTILVNSSGVVANGTAPTPEQHAAADQVSFGSGSQSEGLSYMVNVAEGDQRTMTVPEIVQAYNGGVVNADTYVWAEGMEDWQPLGQVQGIVAALHEPAPASVMPAPMSSRPPAAAAAATATPTPASGGVGGGMDVALSAQPAAGTSRAARRDGGRRDLFGTSEPQASDDVATSAPLFSAAAAASPMPGQQPTGKRDENSVMFSLSALTSRTATAPASTPSKATASKDDSGLIDLKALADAATSKPESASPPSFDVGLFPLGMPIQASPVAAASVSGGAMLPIEAPPKNRTPIYMALGSVAAVGAIIGAFLIMKGGEEKAPAPVPTEVPTVQAAPAPTPDPVPTATAEPTPSASAKAATAKAGRGHGGGGAAKAGSGSGDTSSAPAAQATSAPKATNACGCAPGDLMCAMKCSTKGK